jgi:DNA ligase-4
LLGGHGVTEFLRDPKEWLSTQGATTGPDGTTVPASSCTCSASTGTPRRTKIILIDRRREEASKAFLQLVEAAQLKRRNGEREYVPFYDWRVLEAIRDEERKYHNNKWKPGREFELNYAAGIWRRFWVGLA